MHNLIVIFRGKRNLKELFSYLVFGVLTTLVNIVTFYLCYSFLSSTWPTSNTIAWVISVLFAFVTNKIWVFHSVSHTHRDLLREFTLFIGARLLSFAIDMGSMYLLIEILLASNLIAKLVTQIIIVIANYAFSKLIIFKNKNK